MPETKANETPDVASYAATSAEFLDRAKLELEVRLALRQEYEELLKIWKNNDLAALEAKQNDIIADGLKKYYEDWKKEQKPPGPQDIQKLLDQDYETFAVKIMYQDDAEQTQSVVFTLRELPQTIEKKFYRQFKDNLMTKMSELEALVQSEMDQPFEKKVRAGLELFDESFDVMADAVVLILNPFGKSKVNGKPLDREWVQNTISSDRQWSIITAQMQINRLRDFFSKVSTSSQNMMMMKNPNFQALHQLAV
jgi:hypothetical protein